MRYVMLLAVVLAGCTSPSSFREGMPAVTATSSKPVAAVANCIVDTIESTPISFFGGSVPVSVQSREERTTVQIMDGNGLAAMADVTPTATGSQTRYYERSITVVANFGADVVRRCQ